MAFAVTDVVLATRGDKPEPVPCPHCGEVLTELMGGGFECEVNGCELGDGVELCPVCDEDESGGDGLPCAACMRLLNMLAA